jgi:hypothetical protein
MAFDVELAHRVKAELGQVRGLVEKKMFGGLAFLINGNMSVGVWGKELIVRIPPEETDSALKEPGVRIFDITGKPMKGWVLVGGRGIDKSASLARWVARGAAYASALPKKPKTTP